MCVTFVSLVMQTIMQLEGIITVGCLDKTQIGGTCRQLFLAEKLHNDLFIYLC